MIKYKYAINENEDLVSIDNLNNHNRKKSRYFCISCGKELIARLGKVKVHHFAHKKALTCSEETYLHSLGKRLFFDNYSDCLEKQKPFTIEIYQKRICNHYENEIGLKCKLSKAMSKFDLTKYFDKISIEKREDSFIADILLISKNNKEKLFVEIAVSHLSSEQKLTSDYRIIELEIDNETDFEPIKRKHLSVKDSNIRFINFEPKEINDSLCAGNCQIEYNLIALYKDGRCLLKDGQNLKQIKTLLAGEKEDVAKYKIVEDKGFDYSDLFKKAVATYSQLGLKVKNCFVCRYHALNNSWYYGEGVPIFCKFLKIQCNSNKAVDCEYFKLEKDYVNNILDAIQQSETTKEGYKLSVSPDTFQNNIVVYFESSYDIAKWIEIKSTDDKLIYQGTVYPNKPNEITLENIKNGSYNCYLMYDSNTITDERIIDVVKISCIL